MLGHFSDALSEMAVSLLDLGDGYFKALREVIIETERALQDISRIDAHYISQVVTVMASWQEAVQTAVTHLPCTSGGRAESNKRIHSRGDKGPRRTRCCPCQRDGGAETGYQKWRSGRPRRASAGGYMTGRTCPG